MQVKWPMDYYQLIIGCWTNNKIHQRQRSKETSTEQQVSTFFERCQLNYKIRNIINNQVIEIGINYREGERRTQYDGEQAQWSRNERTEPCEWAPP